MIPQFLWANKRQSSPAPSKTVTYNNSPQVDTEHVPAFVHQTDYPQASSGDFRRWHKVCSVVTVTILPTVATPSPCVTWQGATRLPGVHWCWVPPAHKAPSGWGRGWLLSYLYSLAQAFQGINIQPLLAGLQAGNHLLTIHFARADGETGQAAVEELSKAWLGDFSS